MKLILDSSAAVHIALQTEHAPALMAAVEAAHVVLSPQLIQAEVGNALWKTIRWQGLDLSAALAHYEDALSLVDQLLDDTSLMPQALRLAAQHQHPVYDMLFIAAALQQGARLLTVDKKLQSLAALMQVQILRE